MKNASKIENVPFWTMVADIITNMSRQADSKSDSQDNLRMVEGMIATRGWYVQFPAVLAPMTNWVFDKTPSFPEGVDALSYLKKHNDARAELLKLLEARVTSPKNNDEREASIVELDCFRKVYCDAKGKLHVLTLKNCSWVSSGHQRTEYVWFNAFVEFTHRKMASVAASKLANKEDEFGEWNMDVPALVVEYDDITDVTKDQIRGNFAAGNQNKCTVKDCSKSARQLIGYGLTPKCGENEFRNICSDSGGNAGKTSRQGYLIAEADYQLHGLKVDGFLNSVFAPEFIGVPGEKDPKGNPDWISLDWISIDNKSDPMKDISVICRLLEGNLRKLTTYDKMWGSGNKAVQNGTKPSGLCALEVEVLKRGKALNHDEAEAWVNSVKPYRPGNKAPAAKAPAVDSKKALDAIGAGTGNPEVLKDIAGDVSKTGMMSLEHEAKIIATRDGLNAVYGAHDDATFQENVVKMGLLRDGNKEVYSVVADKIAKMLDKAIASIVPPKAE